MKKCALKRKDDEVECDDGKVDHRSVTATATIPCCLKHWTIFKEIEYLVNQDVPIDIAKNMTQAQRLCLINMAEAV